MTNVINYILVFALLVFLLSIFVGLSEMILSVLFWGFVLALIIKIVEFII